MRFVNALVYMDPAAIGINPRSVLLIALIVIPIMAAVIFWIVYAIRVNRHLKEDKASMETDGRPPERRSRNHESGDPDTFMKGMLVVLLVAAAVVIVLLTTNKKIQKLDDRWGELWEQQEMQNRLLHQENEKLQEKLDVLLKDMKRQNSLLSSFSVTPVENSFDPTTETFAFIIGITPKQPDVTTEITLSIGDDLLTTERDGNVFRAEYRSPLFDAPDDNEVMVSVRQNGSSTPEKIDPELFSSVRLLGYEKIEEYLPIVKCGFSMDNNCIRDGETFRYDDTLSALIRRPELTDDQIVSAVLVVRVNGAEKARHELTDQLTTGEVSRKLSVGISGSVAAGNSNAYGVWSVSFVLEVTDSFGYVYEYGVEYCTFTGDDTVGSAVYDAYTDDPRQQIVRRNRD